MLFDSFGVRRTLSQTYSELVVAQNGRKRLGVAQVIENAALVEGDFGSGKETPYYYYINTITTSI